MEGSIILGVHLLQDDSLGERNPAEPKHILKIGLLALRLSPGPSITCHLDNLKKIPRATLNPFLHLLLLHFLLLPLWKRSIVNAEVGIFAP